MAELVVEGRGHVEEDGVAFRAQQERDVFVGTIAAHAKGINRPRRKRLAATVQRAEVFTESEQRLLRLERGGDPAQAGSMPAGEMVICAADILVVWLLHEALGPGCIGQPQPVWIAVNRKAGG